MEFRICVSKYDILDKNTKSFLEYLSAFKHSTYKEELTSIFQRRAHWGENEFLSPVLPLHFGQAVKGKGI